MDTLDKLKNWLDFFAL